MLAALPALSDYRLELVDKIVGVFAQPKQFRAAKQSDIISQSVLADFKDVLRLHHGFSREPFSKDKFEYALESVLRANRVPAKLAPRGRRGYDIEIVGQRISLKTEAAAAIRPETIHISKFMELGGGHWGDKLEDLVGLRQQFLDNLANVERILILRALSKGTPDFKYELVEIPKALLAKAIGGRLEMRFESSQFPKPGYCFAEENGEAIFSLYFDGGGERKLQIKHLQKRLCLVHAEWQFQLPTPPPE